MAKTELKVLEGCRRQLRIEVEPETVKKTYQEIIRGVEKTAQIPGFRPGKAPREIIKERYREVINKEVVEKLIPETYQEALKAYTSAYALNPESARAGQRIPKLKIKLLQEKSQKKIGSEEE